MCRDEWLATSQNTCSNTRKDEGEVEQEVPRVVGEPLDTNELPR